MKKYTVEAVALGLLADIFLVTIAMQFLAFVFGFTLTFKTVFCVWVILEFLCWTYISIKRGG